MTNAYKACKSTGVKEVYNRNEVEFLTQRRKKDKVKLKIPNGDVLKKITVPKIVVNSIIINDAKLKTHNVTGISLGMKTCSVSF